MAESSVKTAVFLLNMGGPDSPEAVRPFLENLFSDPEIIRFPLSRLVQKPLARFIARKRSVRVADEYAAMGGKSPMVEITDQQAAALADRLGEGYSVHVAMRYWNPRAQYAVEKALEAGAERVIILPLYPHYSRATTGTSIGDIEHALDQSGLASAPRRIVRSWPDYGPYVKALSQCVGEALAKAPDSMLLFSAHGLPVKLIEEGDPYLGHIEATVAAVMESFPGIDHRLAFQSRAGPMKWLEPYFDDELKNLAGQGVKDITVVAVSFVSDHIETLREIDHEYRDLALSLGVERFSRAPSLNVRESFIYALESLVRRESEEFNENRGLAGSIDT